MTRHFPLILIALFLFSACESQDSMKEQSTKEHASDVDVEFLSNSEQDSPGPFSEAVQVGNLLFLSGQIGIDPATRLLVEGGILPEARQTMENIKATLERHGSSLEEVVKCTVMIDDIAEWGNFNEVYVEYFPGKKPARSAFGADGLALGSAVEVECIATIS